MRRSVFQTTGVRPVALALESDLRVNEIGPVLRLEHVAAGPAFQAAVLQFRGGPPVAHVRAPTRARERPRGSGPQQD